MITKEQIREIIVSEFRGTDKFLVDIKVKPGNKIFVFIDSDKQVTINDCVDLSRSIESNFDREMEDFELNVSSAGLDQPLKLDRQFNKYIGKPVEIVLHEGAKVTGTLLAKDEQSLLIKLEAPKKKKKDPQPETLKIELKDIKETKGIISFK